MGVFQMPKPVKVTGLSSTVTKSFVGGIIPCIKPSDEEVVQALEVLGMTPETICCAYCGDSFTEWDHLNPLVRNKKPTGYISEIHNLVPACGKCNQSKGGRDWREWIASTAPKSPRSRGIDDLEERIAHLERYEEVFEPVVIDFEEIVGKELWAEHWRNYEAVISAMEEARDTSDEVKRLLAEALAPNDVVVPAARKVATGNREERAMMESVLQNALYESDKVLTDKAISSRMSRARRAEALLGYSLDEAVSTDEKTYQSLLVLKECDTNGQLQNALRWYYKAKNGTSFPRLSDYELLRGIG